MTLLNVDFFFQLSQEAQSYANYAVNFILAAKQGIQYGQNVYELNGITLKPEDAIRKALERWYSGIYE